MSTGIPAHSGDADVAAIGTDDIAEILHAFQRSEWTGIRLRIGAVTVSASKDGAPPESGSAPGTPVPVATAAVSAAEPAGVAVSATPTDSTAQQTTSTPAPAAGAGSADDTAIDETGLVTVTAPTVGTFWAAPGPGSPPFVTVGARVVAGDQLAIVEMMKLMNPVVSEVSGEIVAVRAHNAELVEFGRPLFLIRPDA